MRVLVLLFLLLTGLLNAAQQPDLPPPLLPEAPQAPASATATAGPATAPTAPIVAYIEIDDAIDEFQLSYLERSLAAAKTQGATVIVTHIISDGGYLHIAEEMVHKLLSMNANGPRLVAFIDRRAWSAAAMIAYAHHEVYLTPSGKIGDIGVIFQSGDSAEPIKYAPEKFETAVRAMLRSIAQNRGWDEARLVKMTARNQSLFRIPVPATADRPTRTVTVIEDDLPTFLADHPEVDPETKVLVAGHDRLMSYTAQEAVDEGMATAVIADLDALYTRIGAKPTAMLTKTSNERLAMDLAGWAPLLAAATILLIIVEMKMGSGLFILLGLVTGSAFLFCQFYLDLANAVDIVMILGGIALILLDLFVLPTGGIIALGGAALLMGGLFFSFMPNLNQFDFDGPTWGGNATRAFLDVIYAILAFGVAVIAIIAAGPRLGLFRRVAVVGEISGTSDNPAIGLNQIGRLATARCDLRPSGYIVLGDGPGAGDELSATARHGTLITAGTRVRIVSTGLGEVVVEPVTDIP
jgi:membrane-bound serine protease (ClpP class)